MVEYTDGTFIIGEDSLNPGRPGGKEIKRIRLSPKASIYYKSAKALKEADLIVIGPGDLYASILPNFVVSGIKPIFRKTKAKIVYIVNLMTRYTQTHGYTAKTHVEVIKNYLGRYPDYVIVNSGRIPKRVLDKYKKEKGYPVVDDLNGRLPYKVIRGKLFTLASPKVNAADALQRSLLLHEKKVLKKHLLGLLA